MRSIPSPALPSAAPSFTPPSAHSRRISQPAFPPIRSTNSSHLASRTLPRSKIFPKRAHFGGRAFYALRIGSRGWDAERRGAIVALTAEIRGETRNRAHGRHVPPSRHRRPHRTRRRRPLPHSRLQDRRRTQREASAHRTGAAAHAGSRDPAPRRLPGHPRRHLGQRDCLCEAQEAASRPGEYEPIKFKDGTPDSQADRALERLAELPSVFDTDTEPYRSLVHPMWRTRYGDYDHLARVKEWSSSGGEIDDIGGGE